MTSSLAACSQLSHIQGWDPFYQSPAAALQDVHDFHSRCLQPSCPQSGFGPQRCPQLVNDETKPSAKTDKALSQRAVQTALPRPTSAYIADKLTSIVIARLELLSIQGVGPHAISPRHDRHRPLTQLLPAASR